MTETQTTTFDTEQFARRLARRAAVTTTVVLSNGNEEIEVGLADAVVSHYEAEFDRAFEGDSAEHERALRIRCQDLVRAMGREFTEALMAELSRTGTV